MKSVNGGWIVGAGEALSKDPASGHAADFENGLGGELAGTLVVSLEQAVAAPYCGLLLADAGARVIKVERPGGDLARGYDTGAGGQSSFFAWLNRGKQSICLDLDIAADDELLRILLRRADVFLHNLAPGALRRRGFAAETLRLDNAGLITCEISGYGGQGAAAQRKAYDFLVQAESGVCAVTGSPDAPSRVGLSITDLATGQAAFSAILRGLLHRGRTGRGIDISLSMFDVMADWMNMPLLGHRYLGAAPQRMGLTHALIAPYGAYYAGDGGQFLLAVQNDREWRNFCTQILDRPDLAGDRRFANNPDRVANRASMDGYIAAAFAAMTRSEALSRLDAAGIANASLNSVADVSVHPCLRNQRAEFGGAEIQMADLPVRTARDRPVHVPQLDEDGAAIRAEFNGS